MKQVVIASDPTQVMTIIIFNKGESAGTKHLGTFSAFHYEHLRHLQHLQALSHYLKCFFSTLQ